MTQNPRLLLRTMVFTAIVLWMQAGPATRALGFPKPPGTMNWVMYQGRASRVCGAQWWTPGPDGERIPVNRAELMGIHRGKVLTPGEVLEGRGSVRRASKRLCSKLEPGTVLRVDARCGSRQGWVTVLQDEPDLCAESEP